jgi:hypothetical protein
MIMPLSTKIWILILTLASSLSLVTAQPSSPAWQELAVDLPYLGTLAPRTTHQITASPWSVGGETMDRDYTVYAHWKAYVEDLGIKKVRLQSGWAKTETQKGKYDFAWLDEAVYDLKEKGVSPWISLSYGNPIYRDGGGTRLGARLPTSGEANEGWRAYVRATVTRYREVVTEWEVWNEPNLKRSGNASDEYARLLLETGKIIKEIQPQGKVLGIAMAGVDPGMAGSILRFLRDHGGLSYVDAISYHPYSKNPDASYPRVLELRDTVQAYAPDIQIYQGENGAPSEYRQTKALSKYPWTELSQAKWALRRLLGDLGRDIESSYFSMVDMQYPDEINRKGLLLIDEEKKVIRPKHAYFAVQHLAAVFDDRLQRIPDFACEARTYHSLSCFGYQTAADQQVAVLWFDGSIPSDYNSTTAVDLSFPAGKFEQPVYVDLRTGQVYAIPSRRWRQEGDKQVFYQIPLYDSPVLIADAPVLSLSDK